MKKTIHTAQDALAFQVTGMYYAERKVKEELKSCSIHVTSPKLQSQVQLYLNSTDNKVMKLERVFNYLMQEPMPRENKVIDSILSETQEILAGASSSHLKNILMINCIQNICMYKISTYRSSYLFAIELELDTAADMIQQILEWEQETQKLLSNLVLEEFNKKQPPIHSK